MSAVDYNAPHLRERELRVTRPPQGEDRIRPELEVIANDSRPIPYDPIEAAKMPPVVYDRLEVYAGYNSETAILRIGSLDNLIDALTELRHTLRNRDTALAEIREHDAAGRDYATMTDQCAAAVRAFAEQRGRAFDDVWLELVHESRAHQAVRS